MSMKAIPRGAGSVPIPVAYPAGRRVAGLSACVQG